MTAEKIDLGKAKILAVGRSLYVKLDPILRDIHSLESKQTISIRSYNPDTGEYIIKLPPRDITLKMKALAQIVKEHRQIGITEAYHLLFPMHSKTNQIDMHQCVKKLVASDIIYIFEKQLKWGFEVF